MGYVVLDPLDPEDLTPLIQPNLAFGKIQVERTRAESRAPDSLGERIGVMQHALKKIQRLALQDGQNFAVIVAAFGEDHRGVELCVEHLSGRGQQELDAFGEPLHVGFERAKLVAQRFRQHGNHAVNQVSGIAAPLCLLVQSAAGLHIM